jgi:hypothetical protein
LPRRAQCAPNDETNDHREDVNHPLARTGNDVIVASGQYLAQRQHEMSDVRGHDGRGRGFRERDLHERGLYGHGCDAEHACGNGHS